MPLLVWAKRRTGRELGSATVIADSTQTLLCTYLSAILLVGLMLNALLDWSTMARAPGNHTLTVSVYAAAVFTTGTAAIGAWTHTCPPISRSTCPSYP